MNTAPRQFLAFGLTGGIGFLTDAGLLLALQNLADVPLAAARLISFTTALTITWQLNRRFTFAGGANRPLIQEWGRYALTHGTGGLINLGLFFVLVSALPGMPGQPITALLIATSISLSFNFLVSRHFVFALR